MLIKITCLCFGLWICLQASADVVINEVFYDAEGSDTGKEWIELYNNGDTEIPLDGYCLYASGEHYVFNPFFLNAGAYIVIHWNADGTDTATDLYTGTADWSNMGNTSGSVALWNTHDSHTQDTIVDYMEYGAGAQTYEGTAVAAGIWTAGDFAADVAETHSLEYDGSGDTGSDWFDQPVPTPGAENPPPITLEIIFPTDGDEFFVDDVVDVVAEVRDRSGYPMAGVEVTFAVTGGIVDPVVVLTGANGQAITQLTVAKGENVVAATLTEYPDISDTVTVIGVVTTGSINGNVSDTVGSPVKFALVIAINADTKDKYKTFTDTSGDYKIELLPGVYWVICIKRGYKPGIKKAAVVAGGSTRVDFLLLPQPE